MSERETKVQDITFDDIIAETDRAWLLMIDDEEVWLPKSQCEMYEADHVIVVPEWLIKEKGL